MRKKHEFCIKNKEFCIENDGFCRASNNNFDLERDFIIAGQAVGGMHDMIPAADLVKRMMGQLVEALGCVPAVATVSQQANL